MNFLRTLVGACAGFRFYRVALAWSVADTARYLAQLVGLVTVVCIAVLLPRSLQWVEEAHHWIERDLQLPVFVIEKGRIRSDAPQPAIRKAGDFTFVLDTTGATQLTNLAAANGILVTTNRVTVWSARDRTPISLDTSQLPDGRVDAAYFKSLMTMTIWLMLPPALGIVFAALYAVALAQAAFFTLTACLMEGAMTPRFHFGNLFRIAVMAVTPAAAVATAYTSFGWARGWVSLIYLLIYAFYYAGATGACRQAMREGGGQPPPL
jgi:hypothetical protein